MGYQHIIDKILEHCNSITSDPTIKLLNIDTIPSGVTLGLVNISGFGNIYRPDLPNYTPFSVTLSFRYYDFTNLVMYHNGDGKPLSLREGWERHAIELSFDRELTDLVDDSAHAMYVELDTDDNELMYYHNSLLDYSSVGVYRIDGRLYISWFATDDIDIRILAEIDDDGVTSRYNDLLASDVKEGSEWGNLTVEQLHEIYEVIADAFQKFPQS